MTGATPQKLNWMHEPLAVVGMACRLPGADSVEEFWQLLIQGKCATGPMPKERLDRKLYFANQKGVRGKTYTDVGGLIRERQLDWSRIPISSEERGDWDLSHLILCEVAAAACHSAGYDPHHLPMTQGGIYVGHSGGSTLGGDISYAASARDNAELLEPLLADTDLTPIQRKRVIEDLIDQLQRNRDKRRAGGMPLCSAGYAAGLLGRALKLSGPQMVVDAACASSLVALAMAASALVSGQIDVAMVAGASFNKSDSLILFSQAQSCSATQSRPFDDAADGLIGSEGYVVLIIKTLQAAQAQGDRIHAIIRGIGISSDGRGKSLWAPRKEGQCTAIERAYSDEVTPDSIQFVEAHATSTQVGDATEMEALATFFQGKLPPGQKLPVGSVKSNIGHTLETAGLAGLLKTILAIQHRVIPPSINIDRLNETIPWDRIPLFVAQESRPWTVPSGCQLRRAAVNAFGIGGLNVHVVVEEGTTSATVEKTTSHRLPASQHSTNDHCKNIGDQEPIAVIGRGLVLPGALNIASFARLLNQAKCVIKSPPNSRWLGEPNIEIEENGQRITLPVAGGYIDQFAYDWRKHKVPPKQIAQANPLQFMLLEATEQALRESGYLDRSFDRAATAVVVGTVFGGDFGNALYAGLRLPEFRAKLQAILHDRGLPEVQINRLADRYEEVFLQRFPALLDETGSFTASTLASRIAKTFDLMGGAMAIDTGTVSSLAAIDAACHLLRGGTVNNVICAAAQSALDRPAFENLAMSKWLQRKHPESFAGRLPSDGQVPGEGVVVLLLKRITDAKRDGDQILATIHEVIPECGTAARLTNRLGTTAPLPRVERIVTAPDVTAQLRFAHAKSDGNVERKPTNDGTCELIGHLQAAQGLVNVLEITCREEKSVPTLVLNSTNLGLHYGLLVESGEPAAQRTTVNPIDLSQTGKISLQSTAENYCITRFAAGSLSELRELLLHPNQSSHSQSSNEFSRAPWRASMVISAQEEPSARTQLLANQLGNDASIVPLAEQGSFWAGPPTGRNKMAWLFPGQSSQYAGMFKDLAALDDHAQAALRLADSELAEMGQPTFEEVAWHDSSLLGEDVWRTQLSVMVADWMMFNSLVSLGHAPDVVSGHSYGELVAMLAAGCWDLKTALQATWHRCQAICHHVPAGCAMLSIHADALSVRAWIADAKVPVFVSHTNAATQTVVGGRHGAVVQFSQFLEAEGINCRLLAVPTAFHTPLMATAQPAFATALENLDLQPPRIPLLSSICNRYVADPREMRQGLVDQLVQPLDFVGIVNRLEKDGVTLAIEVGPQQVLTRLSRSIAGSKFLALATDNSKRGTQFQLACVQAAVETRIPIRAQEIPGIAPSGKLGGNRAHTVTAMDGNNTFSRKTSPTGERDDSSGNRFGVVHFDATQSRRLNKRAAASLGSSTLPHESITDKPSPVHFDATETRRRTSRVQAEESLKRQATQPLTPVAPVQHLVANDPATLISHSPLNSSPQPPAKTNEIEAFLIDFVVEQTGYPAEIIELDWDIEADLGIDSIKKAQLFGELREFFDLETAGTLQLDKFRTLRDISDLLSRSQGKGDWLPSMDRNATAAQSAAVQASAGFSTEKAMSTAATHAGTPARAADPSQLEKFLIDFVVEQTGYPAEIVSMDADLEADLGIDSIKKAQLFGELREVFSLDAVVADNRRLALAEYRTLRQVLDMLRSQNAQVAQGLTPLQVDSPERPRDASTLENRYPVPEFARVALGDHVEQQTTSREDQATSALGYEAVIDGKTVNAWAMASRCRLSDLAITKCPRESSSSADTMCTNVQDQSVCLVDENELPLDKCLTVQTIWERWNSETSVPVAEETGKTHWLLRYRVPEWMVAGQGIPLVISKVGTRGSVQFGAPGQRTYCTWLTDDAMLMSVRLLDIQDEIASPLSAFSIYEDLQKICGDLQAIAYRSDKRAEWIEQAKSWKPHHSFQISAWDFRNMSFNSLENRNGVIVIEKSRLTASAQDTQDIQNWSARIGFSADDRCLVIQMRNHGHLAAPEETRIQVDDLPESPQAPAVAIQSHRDPEVEHVSNPTQINRHESDSVEGRNQRPIASRYVLRMCPAPLRQGIHRQPQWSGAAIIVGDNPVAKQLEARLKSVGVTVFALPDCQAEREWAEAFDRLWHHGPIPHLFLTTPLDADAKFGLDPNTWEHRRKVGILAPYWLCQRWFQKITEAGLVDDASLVAVSSLGGDFGLSGNLYSAEGGGLAGLLKSIFIEGWVQGHRTLPIKILDTSGYQSPAQIVTHVWNELTTPNFDIEVAYLNEVRHVVRAIAKPVSTKQASIRRGATWVCTGGGRGITAFVAEQLAKRYGLRLHLLGTQPLPKINPALHDLNDDGLRQLRIEVMSEARQRGENPINAWQNMEKRLEIDATLRRLASQGIEAHYHSCDISDRFCLERTLAKVRAMSGPIEGVLHGAGVGKDAKFERKTLEKVHQCLAAKVDGTLALIAATQQDPLRYFVGFGSISGRFGANGHTDYSLSNDMLCKQIDWLRRSRPEVTAVGFHWHAWGDIGMAVKPETKLALEMIDMQFMPAQEGLTHLIRELEGDASESEILITDDRYYRLFYPAENLVDTNQPSHDKEIRTPLLNTSSGSLVDDGQEFVGTLYPEKDPFLVEHQLDGHPILPIVVGCEFLLEGAAKRLGQSENLELQDVVAVQGLRCFTDQPQSVKVQTKVQANGAIDCRLVGDFRARDGRLVQADRVHLQAVIGIKGHSSNNVRVAVPEGLVWQIPTYCGPGEKFFGGFPLQKLRKYAIVENSLVGKISAPILIELAGGSRDVRGWILPSAALDACLYATGILAWNKIAPGTTLPARFGRIQLHRNPWPGEACMVHVRWNSTDASSASFDFTLYGNDDTVILDVLDYQIAWVGGIDSAVLPLAEGNTR